MQIQKDVKLPDGFPAGFETAGTTEVFRKRQTLAETRAYGGAGAPDHSFTDVSILSVLYTSVLRVCSVVSLPHVLLFFLFYSICLQVRFLNKNCTETTSEALVMQHNLVPHMVVKLQKANFQNSLGRTMITQETHIRFR